MVDRVFQGPSNVQGRPIEMREPDLSGHAKAWVIPIQRGRPGWEPTMEAGLAHYLLNCNWSHPFWSWYSISGIHLRDIPGVRPAHKEFPEAEHEIQILSLHPKFRPDPDKLSSGEQQLEYLTPPDLVHQVGGLTDDQFKTLVQDIVITIVEG